MGGSSSDSDSHDYESKQQHKYKGERKHKMGKHGEKGLFNVYMAFKESDVIQDTGLAQNQQPQPPITPNETILANNATILNELPVKQRNPDEDKKKLKMEKKEKKKEKKKGKKEDKIDLKSIKKLIKKDRMMEELEELRLKSLPLYYKDDVMVQTIMDTIGQVHNWTPEMIANDMRSLLHNRLFTVGDLRALSAESWHIVELLPLVKDCLKHELNRRVDDGKPLMIDSDSDSSSSDGGYAAEKEKKKREKKDNVESCEQLTDSAAVDKQTAATTGTAIIDAVSKPPNDSHISQASASSLVQSQPTPTSSSSTTSINSQPITTQPPAKSAPSMSDMMRMIGRSSRMVVTSDVDGRQYEVDRYCPHKGADMIGKGSYVKDGMLVCPSHKWMFDLQNGGKCRNKRKTVNAVCLAADPKLQW